MKPLKAETNAVLESASRLGNGTLPRYVKELGYLSKALIAMMGEYGDEIEATSSQPGRPLDTFTLKSSGVGFKFKANTAEDCVNVIQLRLGQARIEKERDVDYARVGGGFNVPRIVERLLGVHVRFVSQVAKEQAQLGNLRAGKRHAGACIAKIYGVAPVEWKAPAQGKEPNHARVQVAPGRSVHVTVLPTAEGFSFCFTTESADVSGTQLEQLMRSYEAKK